MKESRDMGFRLKNKVAVVTGGAYGIGRAFSLGMARESAKIVIADINPEAAEATVKEIEERGGEAPNSLPRFTLAARMAGDVQHGGR